MKILLAAVNAKFIHSCLAVYNLKAYAEQMETESYIVIREYTINQLQDDILRDLYREAPDVLCFSCYIWNIGMVRDLIREAKKILKGVQIWLGGPEVSYDARAFLEKNPACDGVMIGEGEETFRELTACWDTGKPSLSEIAGIAFREDGEIRTGTVRPFMDLDRLPFPYADLSAFENHILYYESSRGCPYSCSYCLSSIDKAVRLRSLEKVLPDLQRFLDAGAAQVKFVDRTFNCRRSHTKAIWQYLLDHDNGITNFHFEITADLLNEEEIELLGKMRPGLVQLEIGVQSTNPETLKAIHREMDLVKLAHVVEEVRRGRNVHQHLDLIAGLPYEGYDRFRKSFNEVYAMKPDQLQLGFLKVLKGSLMMREREQYEIEYKEQSPYEVLSTHWLSYGEILRLKMVESMTEIYYNSGQFTHTIEFLIGAWKDAFSFFEALGDFYEEKGYEQVSHARIRRYEILLEFVREKTSLNADQLIRHMLYDLYIRENLKKRPSFAPSQEEWKEKIWNYRKRLKVPKTAHIEVFSDGSVWLFDYTERDPLSGNAAAVSLCAEEVFAPV